ncbi:MAG: MogA/MoaB family molybdenum cofactor biosynthesis protein [Acidobacteriota bacterium]|nr:MogA/MoaB family molybdenum cofactor biosynthesis protein [Acidobacteriota bacterium]
MDPKTAAVLTVSDSVALGSRVDGSGPALVAALESAGFTVAAREIVPDERPVIEAAIRRLAEKAALVVTTGGTGIAERDVTPEATRAVCDRVVEGVGERMRSEGGRKTPLAALSRGVCGIRGKTLVLNVPGSPDAATESLAAVLEILPHALELLRGKTAH